MAAQSSADGADPDSGLPVHIPVGYEAFDGTEALTLTVEEVVDPFEAARLDRLEEGHRYVAILLRVTNDAQEPARFSVSDFSMLGTDTARYRRASAQRDLEAREEQPDLKSSEVRAGESAEGLLFFELPVAADVEAVLFAPSFDRLLTLAARGSATQLADTQDD